MGKMNKLIEAVEKKLGVSRERIPELLSALGLDATGLAEALEESGRYCHRCYKPVGYFKWRAGVRLCKSCIREGMHWSRVLERAVCAADGMVDGLEKAACAADGIVIPATQEGGIIQG